MPLQDQQPLARRAATAEDRADAMELCSVLNEIGEVPDDSPLAWLPAPNGEVWDYNNHRWYSVYRPEPVGVDDTGWIRKCGVWPGAWFQSASPTQPYNRAGI